MARLVVPVVLLVALVGGYVVGQQPGDPTWPVVSERELAARREHVRELERLCEKIQALFDKGSKGGEQDKLYLTQTRLELARAELAKAEGQRAKVTTHYKKAASAADRAAPAVRSAFDAGVASLRDLLDVLQTRADVKATLARPGGSSMSCANRQNAEAVASERELSTRREHLRELEQLCQKFDAVIRLSDKGLGVEKLRVAQTRLELARVELAKAEGKTGDLPTHYENAARAADRAVTAVRVAYGVGLSGKGDMLDHYRFGESSSADLLDALQTRANVKAALARLPRNDAHGDGGE